MNKIIVFAILLWGLQGAFAVAMKGQKSYYAMAEFEDGVKQVWQRAIEPQVDHMIDVLSENITEIEKTKAQYPHMQLVIDANKKRISELQEYKDNPRALMFSVDPLLVFFSVRPVVAQSLSDYKRAEGKLGSAYVASKNDYLKEVVNSALSELDDDLKARGIAIDPSFYEKERNGTIYDLYKSKAEKYIKPQIYEATSDLEKIKMDPFSDTREEQLAAVNSRLLTLHKYLQNPSLLTQKVDIPSALSDTSRLSEVVTMYEYRKRRSGIWPVLENDAYLNVLAQAAVREATRDVQALFNIDNSRFIDFLNSVKHTKEPSTTFYTSIF